MLRDTNKTEEYFREFVHRKEVSIDKAILKIDLGETSLERVPIVMRSIGASNLRVVVAKYSGGYPISEIKLDYLELLKNFNNYWLEGYVLFRDGAKELKQYLDYDDMLWMLSLGILLNVSDVDFKVLVDLINRDKVSDLIYNYFIYSKLNSGNTYREETYEYGWKLYASIREIIKNQRTIEEKIKLLNAYLSTEWKTDHKEMLKSLSSPHDTYYGAWSFESAAIVAILDLDDSSFRDNQYYPKDLVDYYRSNQQNQLG